MKSAAVAESVGMPVTLHCGGELGLSQAAYLHLAASIPNMTLAIDNELDYLGGNIITEPFVIEAGRCRSRWHRASVSKSIRRSSRVQVRASRGRTSTPGAPAGFR